MATYPSTILRDHFDDMLYDLYWRMVAERQYMYARRVILKQDRPWTTDQFLNAEFITNMYRELDPGTQYVINDILTMPEPVDRLFNVLLYRLMGSQETTHRLIATTAAAFDLDAYMTALEQVPEGKLFGDAYRVAGYETEGGSSKHENIGRLFTRLAGEMPDILRSVQSATQASEVYDVIKDITGFGEFLAHQVSVDLLYRNSHGEALVPFGENQWAMAGPGARRGIWAMLKEGVRPRNLLIVMEYLRDVQEEEFTARGITFPYLADEHGDPIRLSLCNIQSTLCEFYKYVRLWDGSTKKVRTFQAKAASRELAPVPVALTHDQLDAIANMKSVTPPPVPVERSIAAVATVEDGSDIPEDLPVEAEGVVVSQDTPVSDPQTPVNASTSTTLSVATPDGAKISITINFNFAAPGDSPVA